MSPNGAGKTTLLECLTGLLPADGGRVLWNNQPLPAQRRKDVMFYLSEDVVPYREQPTFRLMGLCRDVYGLSHERERNVLLRLRDRESAHPAYWRAVARIPPKASPCFSSACAEAAYSFWMNRLIGWIPAKRLKWLPFSGRSLRPVARSFFPFISLRTPRASAAGFFFLSRERSSDAVRWKSCGTRPASNQKIWRRSFLRLPEFGPIVRANRALVLPGDSQSSFWPSFLVYDGRSHPSYGVRFIQAVDLYTQASRSAVQYPELARGMVPFEGIIVPTLGAFYLASTLFLPFVAVRAVAQDKESGALKLLLQMPTTPAWLIAFKAIAMVIALAALFITPGFCPIWLHLGGHVFQPELLNLLAGHALYALDVAGIAFFAAALSQIVRHGCNLRAG